MRGKFPGDKFLFDPKITKTERKSRKKKKQATTKPLSESSSTNSPSIEKPIVIVIWLPPFGNKVVEVRPTLHSLIGSHRFAGMDHEDPCTYLSTFMELCSTIGASDEDVEVVYLRAFQFYSIGKAKT